MTYISLPGLHIKLNLGDEQTNENHTTHTYNMYGLNYVTDDFNKCVGKGNVFG